MNIKYKIVVEPENILKWLHSKGWMKNIKYSECIYYRSLFLNVLKRILLFKLLIMQIGKCIRE